MYQFANLRFSWSINLSEERKTFTDAKKNVHKWFVYTRNKCKITPSDPAKKLITYQIIDVIDLMCLSDFVWLYGHYF